MSLDVEAEYPRQLGQIVDIAAGLDHPENISAANGFALFIGQAKFCAIGILIIEEGLTIFRAIKRKAHLVKRISFLRLVPIEEGGAGYLLICHLVHPCIPISGR